MMDKRSVAGSLEFFFGGGGAARLHSSLGDKCSMVLLVATATTLDTANKGPKWATSTTWRIGETLDVQRFS